MKLLGVAHVLSPRRNVVLLAVPLPSLATATVPVSCPAGKLVNEAPEPLNVLAVTTPVLEIVNLVSGFVPDLNNRLVPD